MKNNIWKIIVVCSLLCTIACLIRIGGLKNDVQNLNNQLNHRISTLENSFWQSSSNVEEIIKQGSSTLASAEWEYGSFDSDDLTVEVVCTITPKEYNPGKTAAAIMMNHKEIPMSFENGIYTVSVPVSIFDETQVTQVMFYDEDTVRAEGLEWTLVPLQEYLPSIDAYLNGNSMNYLKDKVVWNSKDSLQVFVGKKDDDYTIHSITMVRCLDGEETERVEMPLEDHTFETDYYQEVDLSYEIPFGSVQDIYVDIIDSLGLRYRVCIDHTSISKDGEYEHEDMQYESEKILYDKNGKELYRGFW